MSKLLTIAGITLREAARRKILWTALVAAVVLLAIFAVALRLQVMEFATRPMSPFLRYQVESGMLLIGLYICDQLAVVLTILTSIDTLAGEIGSGTIHAIATKPIARWEILLGKFVGFSAMVVVFVTITFVGTIVVANATTGVLPEHAMRGFLLIVLECELMLAVTFALGTRFSTLTVGVLALGMHGVAFMGGWLEQVSGFSQSAHIVTLGVGSSLLVPSESLWRRAAYEMQTPLTGSLSFSPFANVSIPSGVAVVYATLFALSALALSVWAFSERDL